MSGDFCGRGGLSGLPVIFPRIIPLLLLACTAGAATPPGGTSRPPELAAELATALQAQAQAHGGDYKPRTEHLQPDGSPTYTNRLIREHSPYLLQHAHNPVDWYAWGPEAFAAAKAQNKPIFLSIGYSTCHWCHVMERESFEDQQVAAYLNRHFIAIKVDRERRPEVDEVYMTAVVLLTGRGGWPMSSFLTANGKPFFGGTYYPRAHFLQLLAQVQQAWRDNRAALLRDAERTATRVARTLSTRADASALAPGLAGVARRQLISGRDEIQGGFGSAPKFPQEPRLLFLLDQVRRSGDAEALETAVDSLRQMDRGGIHDQVGGGFHRYSTTPDWLVPHFEKMLYNQALLARAYVQAWQLTGDRGLRRAAKRTLDYVLRDMTSPNGSFYSATDADSEGEEGVFFLWTPAQIRAALEPRDAALAIDLFDISEGGNFEGSNILALAAPIADYAAEHGINASALTIRVDHLLGVLNQVREQRQHPLRDEKRLTAWNGMMITALAEAGRILGEPRYITAAARAADALLTQHRRDDGSLWRVGYGDGASVPGGLDDYAHLIAGLVALYDADGNPARLQQASELADQMLQRFTTPEGGFYMSEAETPTTNGRDLLFLRPTETADGAVPSGNSVAIGALTALYTRTGKIAYRSAAEGLAGAVAGVLNRQPSGSPYFLIGADALRDGERRELGYAAAGKVRADAQLQPDRVGEGKNDKDTVLSIRLQIAPAWHVNSNTPLQPDLIPTLLSISKDSPWQLTDIRWPAATPRKLGFLDQPLSLFEGTVTLHATLRRKAPASNPATDPAPPLTAMLRLQACSDKVCLPPETIHLVVPLSSGAAAR